MNADWLVVLLTLSGCCPCCFASDHMPRERLHAVDGHAQLLDTPMTEALLVNWHGRVMLNSWVMASVRPSLSCLHLLGYFALCCMHYRESTGTILT